MFTSSRRLRAANDAVRAASAKVIERDARIRELETGLADTKAHAQALARSRGDVAHVLDLEKLLKQQAATISQLRRGVVDDAQTLELRRQLGLAQSTIRVLNDRLAELQAVNSRISRMPEVGA